MRRASGRDTPQTPPVPRQAFLYLQASIVGTLANFVSRFPLAEVVGFEASVILSTYVGMVVVFLLSYRRAFDVRHADAAMLGRFILVAHVGLAVVWVGSTLALFLVRLGVPELLRAERAGPALARLLSQGGMSFDPRTVGGLGPWIPRVLEGGCHAFGIVAGFFVNFIGHRAYSFAGGEDAQGRPRSPDPEGAHASALFAVLVPLAYVALYAPYGIDTTDFGFFYGYPWRIMQGEVPFRDFYYTKPPASLYWHALWLWLTPERVSILGGKVGFLAEMLGAAWLGALFLRRAFDFGKLGVPLPLLATAAFVFGVHSFPAMPWHTADGALFGSAALYASICGAPGTGRGREKGIAQAALGVSAGLLAALVVLTKQSFLFIPPAACLVALTFHSRGRALGVAVGALAGLGAFAALFCDLGAWDAFRVQTTGGLSLHEALEAGVFIYIRQNWLLPGLAVLAGGSGCFLARRIFPARARMVLRLSQPVPVYFLLLAIWYIHAALTGPEWIGYGTSWPTLFVLAGGVMVLVPRAFLAPYGREEDLRPSLFRVAAPSVALGACLTLSWSTGISGGYKVPAFFAAPLLFAALLLHLYLKRRIGRESSPAGAPLLWLALVCGLIMFRAGYERPYVFPARDMPRSSLVHDAGAVFPRLAGVLVDEESLALLRELRGLRAKYGPGYKTLPGFPLAYLLTGDKPAFPAEWLQDWEINGETDKVYRMLGERDIIVFFERSQLDTISPDGYARTRYTVPARVRREWRKIDETEHFVVFRRPCDPDVASSPASSQTP